MKQSEVLWTYESKIRYKPLAGTWCFSFINCLCKQHVSERRLSGGEFCLGLVCDGERFKKEQQTAAKPCGDGVMASPEDASYHTSIQIFQTLHLRELLLRDHRALCRLLLGQLKLEGLWLSEGLAASAEMVGLGEWRRASSRGKGRVC